MIDSCEHDLAALGIVAALLDIRAMTEDADDCAQVILDLAPETDLAAMGRMFVSVVERCVDGREALQRVAQSVALNAAKAAADNSYRRPSLGAYRRDNSVLRND